VFFLGFAGFVAAVIRVWADLCWVIDFSYVDFGLRDFWFVGISLFGFE